MHVPMPWRCPSAGEVRAMILGLQLTWMHLIIGGAATGLLIAFQVLVGARKIKFKGRLHMKVHKWGGWILLGFICDPRTGLGYHKN